MGHCSASRPLVCGNGRTLLIPGSPPSSASALIKEKRLTMSHWRCIQTVSLCVLLLAGTARAQSSDGGEQAAPPAADQSSPRAPNQAVPAGGQSANLVTCSSQLGQRIQCAVDTSVGVALVRSRGAAPCLYGD